MSEISLGIFYEPAFNEVETALSILGSLQQPPGLVLLYSKPFGLQFSKTLPPEELLDATLFAFECFNDNVADQNWWS